jgi:hypothetical protein
MDLNEDLYSVNATLRLTSELKLMATSNRARLLCAFFSRNWTRDQKCCFCLMWLKTFLPQFSAVMYGWWVPIQADSYDSEPYVWCVWQPCTCFDWPRDEPQLWDLHNFQWSIGNYLSFNPWFEIYASLTYDLKIGVQPLFGGNVVYINIKISNLT